MNLSNLKYFADSARFASMTKAAELNNLSRPAISHAIQKLEDELGVKLLVHKRRSFELTQAGISLLKWSESLFLEVENIVKDLKDNKGPLVGEFRIGSSRTLATFNLPLVMAQLKKQFPMIDFKIVLANSDSLIDQLSSREIDMAFFVGDESLNDFKNIVVSRGHFCLIKPDNLKEVELEYALTSRRPETERLRALYERNFEKRLPVFSQVESWDAIWTWVNMGICGGLVPDFLFKTKTSGSKNYSVVLPKVFPYEIKAMFPKDKNSHPVIKGFLSSLGK